MYCLRAALLLLVSVGSLSRCCESILAAERNIVVVVTDDQSPDFGVYGNDVLSTPHLDALAADGTRFTHAFCTTASCSASRSVILTGMHNHANGHYGHEHDYHKFNSWGNLLSLPRYLAAAGYRTARAGKFHVAPESVYHFDRVLGAGDGGRNPVRLAKSCRDFLREQSDQPFFLYWCTNDPHRSGSIVKDSPYQPNDFGNGNGHPGVKTVEYNPDEVLVPGFLPDSPECRAELAQYYESVSRVDQGVGQLVEELKSAGVWEQTLFVFMSDHGIAMPGAKTTLYDGGMHSPLLVRNPYQVQRGKVQDAMVSWIDITPTLLDFAGAWSSEGQRVSPAVTDEAVKNLKPSGIQSSPKLSPGRLQGRSFLPLLDGANQAGWDEVYASHTFHEITMYYPMRVVRDRRYKLIWNIAYPLPYPFASDLWVAPTWQAQYAKGLTAPYGQQTVGSYIHRPQFELFDLQADPYEGHNLADDPAHAQRLADMKKKLRAFQQATDDPWILKWEYE